MNKLFESLPESLLEGAQTGALPDRPEMMRAEPAPPFSDPGWLFERRLEGLRCLVQRSGDQVRLTDICGLELSARYPLIVQHILRQPHERFLIDGVVVAEGERISFYTFDLLHLDGYDTRPQPLRQRKNLLKRAFRFDYTFRYTAHRNASGLEYFRQASRRGWPGLLAKRADAPYDPSEEAAWLELPCMGRPEAARRTTAAVSA